MTEDQSKREKSQDNSADIVRWMVIFAGGIVFLVFACGLTGMINF